MRNLMQYKCQEKLQQKAEQYIQALKNIGISAWIIPDSFRDYTVKVLITKSDKSLGNVNLYYSPNKESFSLGTNEMKDKYIDSDLMECFYSIPNKYFEENVNIGDEKIFEKKLAEQKISNSLSELDYYYNILKPYENCDFDFIVIANSIQNVFMQLQKAPIDVDKMRHDFKKLEQIYFDLKELSNG